VFLQVHSAAARRHLIFGKWHAGRPVSCRFEDAPVGVEAGKPSKLTGQLS
jgi:hypothetical protein